MPEKKPAIEIETDEDDYYVVKCMHCEDILDGDCDGAFFLENLKCGNCHPDQED